MAKVAFTGSFDPPHVGHKYIVDSAKAIGLEVVVIVANNTEKVQTDVNERLTKAKSFFACDCYACESDNIGSFILELGCSGIVRGVRNEHDLAYENAIATFNLKNNALHTIYIPSPEHLKDISSSSIRQT